MIRIIMDGIQGKTLDYKAALAILLLGSPIILLSLSLHEYAHGYVAYKCGDSTAKAFGRLTLNPIKHLDPIGTLCMFFIGYGWAKPVPINMRYFRKPKRDLVLVSLAGPSANFLLAVLFSVLYIAVRGIIDYTSLIPKSADGLQMALVSFAEVGVSLNITLGLFNLIPLPPLDGSKILMCLLPSNLAIKYAKFENYTRYIILGVVALSWFAPTIYRIIWMPLTIPSFILNFLLTKGAYYGITTIISRLL